MRVPGSSAPTDQGNENEWETEREFLTKNSVTLEDAHLMSNLY